MKTYLLTWNPKRWQWDDIQDDKALITRNGFCDDQWSSGVTKKIQPGDRVFLMKLGVQKPRGILASGWAISEYIEDIHWADDSKLAFYIDVHFDTIIDPREESIFPIEVLQNGIYASVNWTPQASGMRIPDDVAGQLEKDWAKFLKHPAPIRQIVYADEIDDTKIYHEGTMKQVKVNVYERNTEARAICIRKYGARCAVCGFDFGKEFGEIGAGFMHVHHLKPLSEIRKGYKLNPIEDLRPICPNCHAMIHQRKPQPFTIEELAAILNRAIT
jgi:5-methylcytosine-specific restriction protein A